MTGKRELILARFNYVLTTINGLTVTRNETGFSIPDRPIANQLDGDEDPSRTEFDEQAHSGLARTMVGMFPLVDVLIGDTPTRIGSIVNEWRAKIARAILLDAVKQRPPVQDGSLGALIGMKGFVKYNGLGTRFTHSYSADCDMTIRFAIYTVFDPNNP